jgi:hypothetical protein
VAFLVEETGVRLSALLNPDTLVVRRTAGVQPRRAPGGPLTGAGLADDPLLFTGGGRTELDLHLLFDVSLAGSSVTTTDVRDLTAPLWALAENAGVERGQARPPLVRFVWGKSWSIPGVVVAVAERFEAFSALGAPQRSWLSLRLWRVGEPPPRPAAPAASPAGAAALALTSMDIPEEEIGLHEVVGGGDDGRNAGERLDEIAARYYGEPGLWRLLAVFNGIADPTAIPPPRSLRIPPLWALRQVQ